jgi:hypothetical protein
MVGLQILVSVRSGVGDLNDAAHSTQDVADQVRHIRVGIHDENTLPVQMIRADTRFLAM